MEDNSKKKVAAISAVLHYLQTEEEASQDTISADSSIPAPLDNFWSFSGRQSQMTGRNMAQMRLFPSWKR